MINAWRKERSLKYSNQLNKMQPNQLFQRTRWRLAFWYTGVMSVILAIFGLGVFEAIAHAHRITIEREIKSVGSTLHDSLELVLTQSGKLPLSAYRLIPSLCQINDSCFTTFASATNHSGAIYQGNYYLRLLDSREDLIAIAGKQPENFSLIQQNSRFSQLKDQRNHRYHQISLTLETIDGKAWGSLQVGRSLADFDRYVATVGWILLLGIPLAMGLIGISAWYLAGLAMQPLSLSYRQIQQFTGDVAHELRTPLAAIAATIESLLIVNNLDKEEITETLQVLNRQNNRLSSLVSNLLLLYRLDTQFISNQQMKSQTAEVCLNELIADLVEEFTPLAKTKEIKLIYEFKTEKLVKVQGNMANLYQLVSNLIINALKYTPRLGEVTLTLNQDNYYGVITVADNGIGIAEAEQSRIFERFYRINNDRSRQTGGSGLGLAIAAAIAQVHQGKIEVTSQLGQGSVFLVKLPKKNA